MSLISTYSHMVEPADMFEPLESSGMVPDVREVNEEARAFSATIRPRFSAEPVSDSRARTSFGLRDMLRKCDPGGYFHDVHLHGNETVGVFPSVLYPTAPASRS
jgi:hypothetical protein